MQQIRLKDPFHGAARPAFNRRIRSAALHACAGCLVIGVALGGGCAPTTLREGVPWAIRMHGMADARARRVATLPFLRVDDYLLDRLNDLADQPEPDARRALNAVLDDCHALALEATADEIERLPESAIDEMWSRYFGSAPRPDSARNTIRDRYLQLMRDEYRAFRKHLATQPDSDVIATARLVCAHAEPSVKRQRGAGLLLWLAESDHPAPRGPLRVEAETLDVYEPGDPDWGDRKKNSAEPLELLTRFAPIIIQERRGDATYPPEDDEIGMVRLSGRPAHIEVTIDPTTPCVYGYAKPMLVHGVEHVQLVYVYWFPERPALWPGDPEAGHVDGATVRITLDSTRRPGIVETLQNCGCRHRCYLAQHVEAQARKQFGVPNGETRLAAMKPKDGTPRIEIDQLFTVPKAGGRPMIVSRAGTHNPVVVSYDGSILDNKRILRKARYTLQPYDRLENMPTDFGRASMFGPDGLVHYSGRAEGWLMAPTGMRSAGQPRQRGTQLICWDRLDFDDPHLFDNALRLPDGF